MEHQVWHKAFAALPHAFQQTGPLSSVILWQMKARRCNATLGKHRIGTGTYGQAHAEIHRYALAIAAT